MAATTRIERDIAASGDALSRAPIDGGEVRIWMVPTGMTSRVHELGWRVPLGKPVVPAEGREVPA